MYAIKYHVVITVIQVIIIVLFFAILRGAYTDNLNFDSFPFFSVKKHITDLNAVSSTLQQNISNVWVDSDVPSIACADLRPYDFPQVYYVNSSNSPSPFIPGNPECQLMYAWSNNAGGVQGAIAITGVSTNNIWNCKPAVLSLSLQVFSSTGTLDNTVALAVTITANREILFPQSNVVVGTGFQAQGSTWMQCVQRRQGLASLLFSLTDCATDNSQFCSCVQIFAGNIQNTSFVFPNAQQRTQKMSSLLSDSITQCAKTRRSRDIMSEVGNASHKQTQILFAIGMVLLFNIIYQWWFYTYTISNPYTVYSIISFLYLVITLFIICSGIGSVTSYVEILPLFAAMFLVGGYFEHQYSSDFKPTIHPICFGIIYYLLLSYHLMAQGADNILFYYTEMLKAGLKRTTRPCS